MLIPTSVNPPSSNTIYGGNCYNKGGNYSHERGNYYQGGGNYQPEPFFFKRTKEAERLETLIDFSQKSWSHRLGNPVYRWSVQSDLFRDVEGITYESDGKFSRGALSLLSSACERETEKIGRAT